MNPPPPARSLPLTIAGVLLLLSCAAHAGLGWPAVRHELVEHAAPPDLVSTMAIGWLFGSVAMGAFGVIALVAGLGIAGGGSVAALVVGLAYGGFGVVTYAIYRDPHFLGFVVIGLLAVVGALRALRRT